MFVCYIFVDSTSLRSHRRSNPIIVASHRMFTLVGWLLGRCGRRVLQSGIRAWFTPRTGLVACWSCIHISCICIRYACSPCYCCIFMVLIIVVVTSPCEGRWCCCGMFHHECMVVYAFVMHVSIYMLLCMHFHDYGYACMVGQTCIVRSLYVIRSS